MASVPRFYVYVLARPNGKPFYVGKATVDKRHSRRADHEREARGGHKCHKCNVIRKIWRQGGKVQCYTVFATDDEQEAFDYELATIEMYGLETLCNQTVGGDGGMKGVIFSEETRKKMSARARRLAADPEWRKRVSDGTKRGQADPGVRRRLTEGLHERYADPAYREKHKAAVRKAVQTGEHRARLREGLAKRYSDPAARQRQADILTEIRHRPEVRQKKSESLRRSWQDPAVRERRMQGRRARGIPEYTYTLHSPTGEVFITNDLSGFCKEHGLHRSHMSDVTAGKCKQYRGWTGTREIAR